uniref:Uncharacterized protein n=1 Tax=Glossina palpalis gambiensis TaxID=67801 RepID=A0A1B0B134_9MUSC
MGYHDPKENIDDPSFYKFATQAKSHFVAITLLTNYTDAVDDGDDQQALQCAYSRLSSLVCSCNHTRVICSRIFKSKKYEEKRENKRLIEPPALEADITRLQ